MPDGVRDRRLARLRASLPGLALAVVAVLLFLFAVQLLGAATNALSPQLRPVLERHVVGPGSAVGVSWIASYGVLNGSVVAAIAVTLFDAALVTESQLFFLVIGSRLGGSGIVVFLGGVDYLQHPHYTLREATGLGLLTFLVTHTVYLPAMVLGAVGVAAFDLDLAAIGALLGVRVRWFGFFTPIATEVTRVVGPTLAFVAAFLLLVASMRLFDTVFASVDTRWLQTWSRRLLDSKWAAFALGIVVTAVVTSIAFSLGVVVPLYNRGYVERDDLIPYVLGASLGTLSDTLLVGLVLESPVGFATVLLVVVTAGIVTLLALLVNDRYVAFIDVGYDFVVSSPRTFAAFVAALVVVPLLLVLLPI
ncbi:MAG: sodium:phosphate symporter [Halolamina sp.]